MTRNDEIVSIAKRAVLAASILGVFAASVGSAHATDPRPKTYRERAKHDFRDVQLGLCHPANGDGKSARCSEAVKQTKQSAEK